MGQGRQDHEASLLGLAAPPLSYTLLWVPVAPGTGDRVLGSPVCHFFCCVTLDYSSP